MLSLPPLCDWMLLSTRCASSISAMTGVGLVGLTIYALRVIGEKLSSFSIKPFSRNHLKLARCTSTRSGR